MLGRTIRNAGRSIGRLVPLLMLSVLVLAALFPGFLAPVSPGTLDAPYLAPDGRHLLGTDNIGQDLLTELVYSARPSLLVALFAACLATLLGTVAGTLAGYFGGPLDQWLMRVTDVFLLLPALPLIILMAAYMEAGRLGIGLVIGLTAWPATARIVRSSVQQERGKQYIKSARTFGAGHCYLMAVHVLPGISQVILAKGILAAASAMVSEAGVSFLGLGDPRFKSWGAMLHGAFSGGGLINGAYTWYLPPILCISVTVLSLTLLGQRWIEGREQDLGLINARGKRPMKPLGGPLRCLEVSHLSVTFKGSEKTGFCALGDVNMVVNHGERMAMVGETGSGKSVLLLAIMGLLPQNAHLKGAIRFKGRNLCGLSQKGFQALRGRHVAYVPQGTGQALNPLMRVGTQVAEPLRIHGHLKKSAAMAQATASLERMGIGQARARSRQYPHQYSGGMIQRALVAMGLISGTSLILLDEPTKGLDPHNRDEMLKILAQLEPKTVVLTTHDLAFAERFAHRISVILNGQLVETAPANAFFKRPLHPYAEALLRAQPSHGLLVTCPYAARRSAVKGCPFQAQCGKFSSKCRDMPPVVEMGRRSVRCWLYGP